MINTLTQDIRLASSKFLHTRHQIWTEAGGERVAVLEYIRLIKISHVSSPGSGESVSALAPPSTSTKACVGVTSRGFFLHFSIHFLALFVNSLSQYLPKVRARTTRTIKLRNMAMACPTCSIRKCYFDGGNVSHCVTYLRSDVGVLRHDEE